MDNIFTLNSIIQIRLNLNRGKLFAFFVDFGSSHGLLWEKLHKLGAGSKIIRVLNNLYDKATVAVKRTNGYSRATRVTRGVLQGEVMSSILFCYTYLGVPFSNSVVFINAANTMLSKENPTQFTTI